MLGLSNGEFGLLVFLGIVAFGPKDIPVIARAAGRLTGRAMGFLHAARTKFSSFADQTQLSELQQEVQQAMAQLQAIRHQLNSGVSLLHVPPAPHMPHALHMPHVTPPQPPSTPLSTPDPAASVTTVQSTPFHVTPRAHLDSARHISPAVAAAVADAAAAAGRQDLSYSAGAAGSAEGLESSPAAGGSVPGYLATEVSGSSSTTADAAAYAAMPQEGQAANVHMRQEAYATDAAAATAGPGVHATDAGADLPPWVIPVSAASAGLLPARKAGLVLSGSDIIAEALEEESVARQAQAFISSSSAVAGLPRPS